IEWLLQEYPHLGTNPEFCKAKLECLRSRYGWKKINQWYGMIDRGQGDALVGDLLETHYDPAYRRSISKCYGNVVSTLPIVDLSDQSVHNFVKSLVSLTELCC
ncbi:MAG: tRNA 2-selenouridine(34) synthase MnmH, partial [Moorea sp. SIO4E2]|nr:tRNA 2-selenouridine(34) synthase MnmH [Moorena sp. SIO4E2]